jgi:hypothetical protein
MRAAGFQRGRSPAEASGVTTTQGAPPPPGAGSERFWVCVACRARNPPQADDCASCGRCFGAGLFEPRAAAPRRAIGVTRAGRELFLLLVVFALWKLTDSLATGRVSVALARGRLLWRIERDLRLGFEPTVQRWLLPHPVVVQFLNVYYAVAHLGGMALFLLWLYLRHREAYPRWRTLLVFYTTVCLIVEIACPVAPPRLLPGLGFVDTALRYQQSIYPHDMVHGFSDQFSTLPSLHIGWAVFIAYAVIKVSRSRWRWLVVIHPVLTFVSVIGTANHFWIDGAAAEVLLLLCLLATRAVRRVQSAGQAGPGADSGGVPGPDAASSGAAAGFKPSASVIFAPIRRVTPGAKMTARMATRSHTPAQIGSHAAVPFG